jgi:hypothetical protein
MWFPGGKDIRMARVESLVLILLIFTPREVDSLTGLGFQGEKAVNTPGQSAAGSAVVCLTAWKGVHPRILTL